MKTRRHDKAKQNKHTRRRRNNKSHKMGKKWLTAIDAASKTLEKTGSIVAARESLRRQALYNARKLFGAVGR